jgi:hypothetical protein
VLVMAVLFVQARRNVWPFTATCLMVLAVNARSLDPEALWRKLSRRGPTAAGGPLPPFLRWPARLGVLTWVVLECVFIGAVLLLQSGRPQGPTRLSRGVVRFAQEQSPSGRIFNDYENAAYLQWRFMGEPALYVDKLNAYPDAVLTDYWDIVAATERGRALLDEQRIGVVILTTNRSLVARTLVELADALDADVRWVRVYVGKDGVIWVRRTAEYEHIWRPRDGVVSRIDFGTLERYGHESQEFNQPIVEDLGRGPGVNSERKK